jgi:hypothetical protein
LAAARYFSTGTDLTAGHDRNARLPENKQFARQGWQPAKFWDFYCTYWRSGLSRRPLVCQAMLSAAMLVTAVATWSFLAAR